MSTESTEFDNGDYVRTIGYGWGFPRHMVGMTGRVIGAGRVRVRVEFENGDVRLVRPEVLRKYDPTAKRLRYSQTPEGKAQIAADRVRRARFALTNRLAEAARAEIVERVANMGDAEVVAALAVLVEQEASA
jgi:hypothetical protein